jgi:class 3 adenylate cyclase
VSATDLTRCLRCSAGNRPGRQFCAECGSPLPVACVACGFANAKEEKFCGGCGTALAPASPPAPAASPAPANANAPPNAADAGERRPVTVMFADLTGYTRLSQQLDPEDVHDLLGRYFAVADAIVERCGGSVDKHIGDSVMAVFGAPVAHGDDGLRALRAADAIQRAVPELGAQLGHPLAVHIGVAAGEVMASGLGDGANRAYTVIGHSVNLASRLLSIAGPGETLMDDAVLAAAGPTTRCEALGEVAVKGVETPVRAFRLAGFDADPAAVAQTRFVGRDAELAQLTTMLRACQSGHGGGTVVLRGEAGMGKTRLVAELRHQARSEGFTCVGALVLDFGMAKGREAIREIATGLLQLDPTATAAQRVAAATQLACPADELSFLNEILDVPQPAPQRALLAAMDDAARERGRAAILVRLLRAAAQAQPVLLTIEDVHWADRSTLAALARLVRDVPQLRVVMVMTTRTEGDPFEGPWRASVLGSALQTLDLGPLREGDALALASGLVATSQRFARRCIERAAGNPLFLEQLLLGAQEHEERLPASLASLVLARMDRLPERDRAALRAAAVIGQRFSLPMVRALAGLPDYDCANLQHHCLARPDGEEFLFAHALIRDGVYASLTRTRRCELHQMAAQWYGDRDPSLTAEHLERAGSPAAPAAYRAAAQAQADALQLSRALALAQRGAALATRPEDACALNLLASALSRETGDGARAVSAGEAALPAATDPRDRCRAFLCIAAGHRLVSAIDPALAALAAAEPIARAHGLGRELSELHYLRGNLHFARGEIEQCRAEHTASHAAALALADPEWEARALSGLADADYLQGLMRAACARFVRCVALCDAHGLTRFAIPNRVMIGHCRTYLAEFDAGLADMRAAHAMAVQVGDRHAEMFATQSAGLLLTACSRYAEAAPYQEDALAQAEALGARRYLAVILAHRAESRFMAGDRAEASENLQRALALARETGMGFSGPMILGLLARIADDPAARDRYQAECDALLAAGCVSHSHFQYYRCAIEDALFRGEWQRLLRHAAALAEFTRNERLPYCDFLIARAEALAALAQRPQDGRARAGVERLREQAEKLHWPIGWPEWA